jgi:hypothetical protein
MESFPEVNWSEICRKAVLDYINTRSQVDLAAILRRLKNERGQDYRQGQAFALEKVIPKLSWKDFELHCPRFDVKVIVGLSDGMTYEAAEREAIFRVQRYLKDLAEEKKILGAPESPSDAFCEGFIAALMEVYNRAKR